MDISSGQLYSLRTDLKHHIYVELPALGMLDNEMARGPRQAWPIDDTFTPTRHPFLPHLGPLFLLPSPNSYVKITPSCDHWPLLIDGKFARVAGYLDFMLSALDEEVLPSTFFQREYGLDLNNISKEEEDDFWENKCNDPTWDPKSIIASSFKNIQGIDQSVGSIQVMLKAMSVSLCIIEDLDKEMREYITQMNNVAFVNRKLPNIAYWVFDSEELDILLPESAYWRYGDDNAESPLYVKDFFKLFLQLQVVEASQLIKREFACSFWAMSRKLHNPKASKFPLPDMMVCGDLSQDDYLKSLVDRLKVKTILSDESPQTQARFIRSLIAQLFGFSDAISLGKVLNDAGFVLTDHSVAQLLQLHGRRRINEPIIFEGDTGVGKSFLLQLYCLLLNQDPGIVFNGRLHLVSVLKSIAARHLAGGTPAPAAVAEDIVVRGDNAGAEEKRQIQLAWEAVSNLSEDSVSRDIVTTVLSLVKLDRVSHAKEISSALAAYFSVLCTHYGLMRDGAGPILKRLMDTIQYLPRDSVPYSQGRWWAWYTRRCC